MSQNKQLKTMQWLLVILFHLLCTLLEEMQDILLQMSSSSSYRAIHSMSSTIWPAILHLFLLIMDGITLFRKVFASHRIISISVHVFFQVYLFFFQLRGSRTFPGMLVTQTYWREPLPSHLCSVERKRQQVLQFFFLLFLTL